MEGFWELLLCCIWLWLYASKACYSAYASSLLALSMGLFLAEISSLLLLSKLSLRVRSSCCLSTNRPMPVRGTRLLYCVKVAPWLAAPPVFAL